MKLRYVVPNPGIPEIAKRNYFFELVQNWVNAFYKAIMYGTGWLYFISDKKCELYKVGNTRKVCV